MTIDALKVHGINNGKIKNSQEIHNNLVQLMRLSLLQYEKANYLQKNSKSSMKFCSKR